MAMTPWLFLLLPVAAASGWLTARWSATKQKRKRQPKNQSQSYYRGLNYLLHDRPDKAIEVFIEMVHVDSETAETHLALGSLFRRRGEVDRAIRIHQNIIARPTLTAIQRDNAFFELGTDYARAGLLDRAEEVMLNLLKSATHSVLARENLLQIYQQQKEWERAVDVIYYLIKETPENQNYRKLASQFCCELANKDLEEKRYKAAEAWLKKATGFLPDSVRANLIGAQLAENQGKSRDALEKLQRVLSTDPDYIPEVLPLIKACYRHLDDLTGYRAYLEEVLRYQLHLECQLEYAQLLNELGEADAALTMLAEWLEQNASRRGLFLLVKIINQKQREQAVPVSPFMDFIEKNLESLVEKKLFYRCENCGFEARNILWRCPSCQQWETFKSI